MRIVQPLALGLASCLCLTSCLGIGVGSNKKVDATTKTDSAATDAGLPTGVDCLQEASTGATICSENTLCPKTIVDHEVYPSCGFRIVGTLLDIECACEGYLCPLGTATTCAQAASLMESQTQWSVCSQVDEGRCTKGSGTATTTKTCDEDCRIKCTTNECEQRCGC